MKDACHFLKYGTVLHGEWFIDGQRVPLAEGSHRQPEWRSKSAGWALNHAKARRVEAEAAIRAAVVVLEAAAEAEQKAAAEALAEAKAAGLNQGGSSDQGGD